MVRTNKDIEIIVKDEDLMGLHYVVIRARKKSNTRLIGLFVLQQKEEGTWAISNYFIEYSFRESGVGSVLINRAKSEVIKRNGTKLIVSSPKCARKFFEKLGMRPKDSTGFPIHSHVWGPKQKPAQNPRGTTKQLPKSTAPQNRLRKSRIFN